MIKDVKEYEQFLARRNPLIQHAQELVLQSWARLIFAGVGRTSAFRSVWSAAHWSWFEGTPQQAIRDAVVLNLGIEPKNELYRVIKRLIGPKQSTFLTADFSQLERRVLAHYYGMSDDKFWKEYGQDLASIPGSVTGRFSGGGRSNFYDSIKRVDPDTNGLRSGRLEGVRSVTGRLSSQNPPESLYPYQSRIRKLPPLD